MEHGAFGPGWLGSTQRLFALARALQAHDWRTTLLGSRRSLVKRHRLIERAFPGVFVRTPFPSGAWPRALDYPYVRSLWIQAQPRGTRCLVDDPEFQWAPRMEKWAQARAEREGEPDVIWGISYGSLRSAVAARHACERLDVPLVVEFQDPCPYPGEELDLLEARALERTLQYASAVITTTSTYASELSDRFPKAANKIHVIHLTMPPKPPQARIQSAAGDPPGDATLTLLHPGTLYGGGARNARSLVRALPLLFERRPEAEDRVRLRLVGGGPGLAEAAAEAKKLSVAEAVSVEDPVPPEMIWQQMVSADCLVVIKHPGGAYNAQIPGKVFCFLAAERPILALVPEGETATIVRGSGLGLIAPPDDAPTIADRLVDLWDAKVSGRSTVAPVRSYISRFSEENMGDQLRQLLDTVRR